MVGSSRSETLSAATAPLRIFLVEDSEVLRNRLVELLRMPGEVEIAGVADTEEDSVRWLTQTNFDVAIVDLSLRAGSGFGVIKALRERHPAPPPIIIVLTNYAFPEFEYACRKCGADFFFDKSRQIGALQPLLANLRARPH